MAYTIVTDKTITIPKDSSTIWISKALVYYGILDNRNGEFINILKADDEFDETYRLIFKTDPSVSWISNIETNDGAGTTTEVYSIDTFITVTLNNTTSERSTKIIPGVQKLSNNKEYWNPSSKITVRQLGKYRYNPVVFQASETGGYSLYNDVNIELSGSASTFHGSSLRIYIGIYDNIKCTWLTYSYKLGEPDENYPNITLLTNISWIHNLGGLYDPAGTDFYNFATPLCFNYDVNNTGANRSGVIVATCVIDGVTYSSETKVNVTLKKLSDTYSLRFVTVNAASTDDYTIKEVLNYNYQEYTTGNGGGVTRAYLALVNDRTNHVESMGVNNITLTVTPSDIYVPIKLSVLIDGNSGIRIVTTPGANGTNNTLALRSVIFSATHNGSYGDCPYTFTLILKGILTLVGFDINITNGRLESRYTGDGEGFILTDNAHRRFVEYGIGDFNCIVGWGSSDNTETNICITSMSIVMPVGGYTTLSSGWCTTEGLFNFDYNKPLIIIDYDINTLKYFTITAPGTYSGGTLYMWLCVNKEMLGGDGRYRYYCSRFTIDQSWNDGYMSINYINLMQYHFISGSIS